jgi:transcriptional regulator with XRE-family HTH domain
VKWCGHNGWMGVRQGPVDLGEEDARQIRSGIAGELRRTRIALGLSQAVVARSAGISPSMLGRIERNLTQGPSLAAVARAARVLGLQVSVQFHPAGSPIRDRGQQRTLERFLLLPAAPLRFSREVGLPIAGDMRAWDGAVADAGTMAFVDCESRLGDIQALERRLGLKLRDDPRSRVLILVVARTRHNRSVLQHERESLRAMLPLDGPAIARALRQGRLPPAGGLIVI